MTDQRQETKVEHNDYHRGREQGFAEGVKRGIEQGDSRTTIVGVCAVAAVLLGLFFAIALNTYASTRGIVEQTQTTCTGDLTEPARAIACALAAGRRP